MLRPYVPGSPDLTRLGGSGFDGSGPSRASSGSVRNFRAVPLPLRPREHREGQKLKLISMAWLEVEQRDIGSGPFSAGGPVAQHGPVASVRQSGWRSWQR